MAYFNNMNTIKLTILADGINLGFIGPDYIYYKCAFVKIILKSHSGYVIKEITPINVIYFNIAGLLRPPAKIVKEY